MPAAIAVTSRCGKQFHAKSARAAHWKDCQECEILKRQSQASSRAKWRELNPEKHQAAQEKAARNLRKWQAANPEETALQLADMQEKSRIWVRDNPEKRRKIIRGALAKQAEIRKENPHWQSDLQLKWRAENPDLDLKNRKRMSELRKQWWIENPEKGAEIVMKAHASVKKSKMEAWLRESGTLTWETAQIRCGEERKQTDFVSPDHKIWVEVDGPFHFFDNWKNRQGEWNLINVQFRDQILKDEALRRGDVTLIRLSLKCFVPATGKMRPEWLEWLLKMLQSPIPGVWCCGELYRSVPWANDGCTILKSPTPNTTSCSQTVL